MSISFLHHLSSCSFLPSPNHLQGYKLRLRFALATRRLSNLWDGACNLVLPTCDRLVTTGDIITANITVNSSDILSDNTTAIVVSSQYQVALLARVGQIVGNIPNEGEEGIILFIVHVVTIIISSPSSFSIPWQVL